jgi:alpha-L-fucosidase
MIYRFIILFFFFIPCSFAKGQWSVLNTDIVPKQIAYKYQAFTKGEWNASNFATPEQMQWFTKARYGMFIHFGLSAYVKKDISWQICYTRKAPDQGNGPYPDSVWTKWPTQFKLEKFNAEDWVNIAREAGMKYIVIISKHHDGFSMWDTKYSDFKITNTPFGRDYLKELIDACHKAKMPVGIYYSQRDWHQADYAPVDTSSLVNKHTGLVWQALNGGPPKAGPTHKKYIEYEYNQVRELCTRYGKIDIFWFDAVWWGGMFNADMWDAENLTRMIRKLQPGIIINNRASLPGDFDTPEQQVGRYQARPWESALTLNGSWAYSPKPNLSLKILLRQLFSSSQGNGNVLLSWGAHWNGEFDSTQKSLLLDIGEWLKKYGYAFYNTKGGPWLPGSWGGATYNHNKVYLYVYAWKNGKTTLPAIPGNIIQSVKYANINEPAKFTTQNNEWQFNAPDVPDSIATIIELTMHKPVTGMVKSISHSLFDEAAYGKILKTITINKTDWHNNQFSIIFDKLQNITGVGIYNNKNPVSVSVSVDGKTWKPVGIADELNSELSLNTYLTGAMVLGSDAKGLTLKTKGQPGTVTIKVYSK